jgi:hypothetical protein
VCVFSFPLSSWAVRENVFSNLDTPDGMYH